MQYTDSDGLPFYFVVHHRSFHALCLGSHGYGLPFGRLYKDCPSDKLGAQMKGAIEAWGRRLGVNLDECLIEKPSKSSTWLNDFQVAVVVRARTGPYSIQWDDTTQPPAGVISLTKEECKLAVQALGQCFCRLETGGNFSYDDMQRMDKASIRQLGLRMPTREQLEEAAKYRTLWKKLSEVVP